MKKYYMNIVFLMVFELRRPEIYRKCSNIHLEVPGRNVGPYCISPLQTGAVFQDFLPNFLLELLQDVDLHPTIHLCFIHDGDAPHFLLSLREFLSNVCLE
jgi:hypothetical protein